MKIAVQRSNNSIPTPPRLPSTGTLQHVSSNLNAINTSSNPKNLLNGDGKAKLVTNRMISCHQPKRKMKSLFWTKLGHNELKESPLWQAISLNILDSLPIDYELLEERFSAQDSDGKSSKRRNSIADMHSFRPKSLLDSSRTQNILISAGKLRGISDDILSLLKDLNPIILTEELVKILQNIIPTSDEIRILRGYEGDRTLLGPGEQFLLPLCDVPRLSQRLFCHLTILTWIPSALKISHKLSILEKIYSELVSDESLHHMSNILQYAIAIGNFLNGGSHRVSTAVRISSILKFVEIRSDVENSVSNGTNSESGRYTLLTFLVSQLMKNCPHSLRYICEYWTDVLSIVEGEISFSQLISDASHLQVFVHCSLISQTFKNEVVKLREELKICNQQIEDEHMIEWNIALKNHLDAFLQNSACHLDNLQRQLNVVVTVFQRTLIVYGETLYPDHKTLEGEDANILFLGTINKIVTALLNTKKEVEKSPLHDVISPRVDDGNTARRRWSMSTSKSKAELLTDIDPTPPPPPPKKSTSTPSTPQDPVNSPSKENVDQMSPLCSVDSKIVSNSIPVDPVMLDSSKTTQEKPKSEKSTRTSRSKARIATL